MKIQVLQGLLPPIQANVKNRPIYGLLNAIFSYCKAHKFKVKKVFPRPFLPLFVGIFCCFFPIYCPFYWRLYLNLQKPI